MPKKIKKSKCVYYGNILQDRLNSKWMDAKLNTDAIDNILENYSTLTKSGKKIADYILSHVTETQYMSINNLSEESNVAQATISRFCRELGYEGYNDFKLGLAKSYIQRKNGNSYDENLYEAINNNDSIDNMCKKLLNTNVGALTHTLDLLDEKAIIKATDVLCEAKRVHCIGQGSSQIMALAAWGRFLTVDSKFTCIQDSHLQAIAVSLLKSDDVILCFSYSGATKDLLDVLPFAKTLGIKIILVTHFKKSPASEYADIIFLCGSTEGPLQMGSIATKISELFIIDVIFHEYCRRNTEMTTNNKVLTSDALANKLL